MSHSHAAQWSRFEAPRLAGIGMPARFEVPAPLVQAIRTSAQVGAGVMAVVGFAGVMWLLVAGPGFLDGHSSTVEHGLHRAVVRQAAR
jgi:cytochrome P450